MTSHRLDISFDDNFFYKNLLKEWTPRLDKCFDDKSSFWHIFRRLLLVLINLTVTTLRLEKSFNDVSFMKIYWISLLVLTRLSMTFPRPQRSFEDNIITRSRPQKVFQTGENREILSKVLWSVLLVSICIPMESPRPERTFKTMSSRGEHVSRRGDIIENSLKSTPRLHMYSHDISSSLEIFRSQRDHKESFSEHIS